MAARIGSEKIEREPNYIYYVDKAGYASAAPRKGHKGAKHRASEEHITRKPGYLYYIDKEGYIAEARMKHTRAR